MAAIFNLPLTSMSKSVHTGPAVMLNHKNVGAAFGISLLTYISVLAAIFNLPHNLMLTSVHISHTALADPETVFLALEISMLSCIKLR